jgi:protocatechuate 3,4-dioxygenase beta subunit
MIAWLAPLGIGRAADSHYAAISGVVLNDATGAPIRRAVITLSTLDTPPLDAVTFTEANGAFGFSAVPPGKYRLRAWLNGYQNGWFGAATPSRAPGTLALAAGDVRYGITFRLRPLGTISGTVFDPDGDPAANVTVRLLKSGWDRRKSIYERAALTNTDDRGAYYFSEVTPGRYLIMAIQAYRAPMLMQPEVAVGQSLQTNVYGAQFYPNANRVAEATPVEAAPGKDVEGVDFHLAAKAVAPLHGRVAPPEEMPADASALITVYPQEIPQGDEQTLAVTAMGPKFEFSIENQAAGSYLIEARISQGEHEYRDIQRVELAAGGQEITLHPERGIDLSGRVDVEGYQRPAEGFTVSLEPGGYPPGRSPIEAKTGADGSFTAHNVTPGTWDIDVRPIPAGGYIQSMRLGERDVLTEDMSIDAGTREPLEIVISARGAVVSGTVTVPQRVARSARSRVMLAPTGKYAEVLSFYAETDADESGHFEFKGVTPGRYKLYAFEELAPSAYDDPNFLQPFEAASEAFAVTEGALVKRQTPLILTGTQPGTKP